ncbi:MAG: hypothetical protein R2701_01105 [Acidimicrobiales bacterium]
MIITTAKVSTDMATTPTNARRGPSSDRNAHRTHSQFRTRSAIAPQAKYQ